MNLLKKAIIFYSMGLMIPIFLGVYFCISHPNSKAFTFETLNVSCPQAASLVGVVNIYENNNESLPIPQLQNPPEIIKAIYVTSWSAGTPKYVNNYLENILKTTEINAVVIDVKDYSGLVSYSSGAEKVKEYKAWENRIPNLTGLIKQLHSQGIYVIARITVFEDPALARARPDLAIYNETETTDPKSPVLWQDNHGLYWLDPASEEVWDYNIDLAKDAIKHGFDEINFDYIRFPSDGKIENMGFPYWDGKTLKHKIIKNFFQKLREELKGYKISADLFGQTTTDLGDMGIGQILESAFENFDYISPMVYPSHYAKNFIGLNNPAEYPYEVIKYSMDSALNRKNSFLKKQQDLVIKNSEAVGSPVAELQELIPTPALNPLAKFRPWLQDFDMGAEYNTDMVKKEIKATKDALGKDFSGFMLWNPSNIYTQGAILNQN